MDDKSAVSDIYERLIEAWNTRDAEAYASLFAPDANVIGFDGSQMDGRAAIESELAAIFSSHPTQPYVTKVREVRSMNETTYMLRAVAGMLKPGTGEINAAVNAIQTLVVTKGESDWKIALFQNTPAQFHGRPELAQALTAELQGMADR